MKLNQQTLKNNLKALKPVYKQLSEDIGKAKTEEWIEIINSKNGMPNLLIKQGAKLLPAYDIDNPRKEATEAVKGFPFNKESMTIIAGAGLGYLAKTILSKSEKEHHVLILEPNLYLLKLFLSHYNFEKVISSGSLILVTNKEDFSYILSLFEAQMMIENYFFLIERYTALRKEYNELTNHATDMINQVRSNTGTVCGAGYQIAENDIAGFPYYIKRRGVDCLKDIYKGKTGVLVSTGPSLSKNITVLKEMQNNVIIGAVGQALRILLAYDIRPTILGAVDFGEINHGHYKGLMDSDVPIAILNRCYHKLFREYKGPIFVAGSGNGKEEESIFKMIDEKGTLASGGSVSHFVFSLLIHMGCNPIIFIGQDLSYPDIETTHFSQTDELSKLKLEEGIIQCNVQDHRSVMMEEKNDFGKFSMGAPVYLPGYYGGRALSNTGLQSFYTSFVGLIEAFNIIEKQKEDPIERIWINSTEGGVDIKGTQRMPLKKALNEHAKNPIDKSAIEPYLDLDPKGDELIEKSISLLKKDIKDLNVIHRNSSLALKYIRLIEKYKDDKEKLKEALDNNEKTARKAEAIAKSNPLMTLFTYREEREIHASRFSHKRNQAKGNFLLKEKGKEVLDMRTQRSTIILEAAKKAAYKLKRMYVTALELLKEYLVEKDNSLLMENILEPIDLSDANKYFERGNFAHPLLDARKLLYNTFLPDFNVCYPAPTNEKSIEAKRIEKEALEMRTKLIKEAKEIEKEDPEKAIKYAELIEKSRKLGKEEVEKCNKDLKYIPDFSEISKIAEEAYKLYPDKEEAIWGVATSRNHNKQYKEAEEAYNILIEKFPDKLGYQFELSLVLLYSGKVKEAVDKIVALMGKTNQFDHFKIRIADLYREAKQYEKAVKYYSEYLDKYSSDFTAWERKAYCFEKLGKKKESKMTRRICNRLKGIKNNGK